MSMFSIACRTPSHARLRFWPWGSEAWARPLRTLINEYGDFTGDLADIHQMAAVGRCGLEDAAQHKQHDVRGRTRIFVPTIGALLKPSAQKQFKAGDDGVLALIGNDEAARTPHIDYGMLMFGVLGTSSGPSQYWR